MPHLRHNCSSYLRRHSPSRRAVLAGAGILLAAGTPAMSTSTAPSGFSFDDLAAHALELSRHEMKPGRTGLPAGLDTIGYDLYRAIRFRPAEAIWQDESSRFSVQLFHLGLYYRQPVRVHLVQNGRVDELSFSPRLFSYPDAIDTAALPADLGFAGLRLHYPLNRRDYRDEVIVFQGASYLRALGAGDVYGASVRGIAVDTGLPRPEEFPRFTSFWLLKPAPGAASMSVLALLEGPSLTGAYRFEVHPGAPTRVDVDARLFGRRSVELLGIAPITSMYFSGENDPRPGDYRPEVHDSDVLLIAARSGEWILRPLQNPRTPQTSRFEMQAPRGFGLLQRDVDFDHYQDLEAVYHRRPSVWVEPLQDWGRGHVRLVEMPAADEYQDNVNAFWVPAETLQPGGETRLRYRLHFGGAAAFGPREGRVLATRWVARGDGARFFVDFDGKELNGLTLEPVVTALRGQVRDPVVQPNPFNGSWRAFFDVVADGREPVELRALLRCGERTATEVWSYSWLPS